jgi:hypothetical protein
MIRTTPLRRISLHFSQIRRTLDRTFMIHPFANIRVQVKLQDSRPRKIDKPRAGILAVAVGRGVRLTSLLCSQLRPRVGRLSAVRVR